MSFLTLTLAMMQRTTHSRMLRSAEANNESRTALLMVVVSSACVSMLAIVYMLKDAKGLSPNLLAQHVGLAVLTVICSWLSGTPENPVASARGCRGVLDGSPAQL